MLVGCTVNVTDDIKEGLAPMKASIGFYIGGMGSQKRNFHKELMARMGYEAEAEKIQELFLSDKRAEAIAMVPDEFCDEISLVGPPERIRDRLQAWQESPVTHLLVFASRSDQLQRVADVILGA